MAGLRLVHSWCLCCGSGLRVEFLRRSLSLVSALLCLLHSGPPVLRFSGSVRIRVQPVLQRITDHTNLTYWKTPRTINRRVARWFTELQDYNLVIKHVPGKIHAAADMLSRPPGVDKGEDDNMDVMLLPEPIFVRLADKPDPKWTSIEERVQQEQQKQPQLMKEWRNCYQLEFVKLAMELTIRLWKHEGKMVFPPNDKLK